MFSVSSTTLLSFLERNHYLGNIDRTHHIVIMASVKYTETISLLRSLVSEIGKALPKTEANVRNKDPLVKHILQLYRSNQVTEKQLCRSEDHYRYFAQTYLSYLSSLRKQKEITNKYFSQKERSIEESARTVGLELPKVNQ